MISGLHRFLGQILASVFLRKLKDMYQRGQLIEATISDRAEDDRCFARLSDGICVFVQGYLAVGDVVEAEILKVKKNYLEAKAKRVLQPSAQRTAPRCTHFGVCGGCKWQHLNYNAQLAAKSQACARCTRAHWQFYSYTNASADWRRTDFSLPQ
jgi:tRNA/tmRNA/rRNA uracil-C5-methylase (TrmA/RlmC/RlmD family)